MALGEDDGVRFKYQVENSIDELKPEVSEHMHDYYKRVTDTHIHRGGHEDWLQKEHLEWCSKSAVDRLPWGSFVCFHGCEVPFIACCFAEPLGPSH